MSGGRTRGFRATCVASVIRRFFRVYKSTYPPDEPRKERQAKIAAGKLEQWVFYRENANSNEAQAMRYGLSAVAVMRILTKVMRCRTEKMNNNGAHSVRLRKKSPYVTQCCGMNWKGQGSPRSCILFPGDSAERRLYRVRILGAFAVCEALPVNENDADAASCASSAATGGSDGGDGLFRKL